MKDKRADTSQSVWVLFPTGALLLYPWETCLFFVIIFYNFILKNCSQCNTKILLNGVQLLRANAKSLKPCPISGTLTQFPIGSTLCQCGKFSKAYWNIALNTCDSEFQTTLFPEIEWTPACLFISQRGRIKILSEVGFEPTPPFGDQNSPLLGRLFTLSLAP